MRLLAIIPILLSAAAIVLSFLCIFAGNKPSFMQSFDLLTLNTSRIGQGLLNNTGDSDNGFLTSLLKNATSEITDEIQSDLNSAAASIAKDFGIKDWYAAHLLDYCEGTYTPGPVPNASVHNIHKNVSSCSNRTSMFTFDPKAVLERSIADSGLGLDANKTLDQLGFSQKLEDGVRALRIAWKAMFVLYCIGIGLSVLCLLTSIFGVFGNGRLIPAINVILFFLAFLVLAVASAIATAVAAKGSKEINKYGKPIGVEADRGNKFLVITWVATGAMFLGSIAWCVGCIAPGRRRHKEERY